MTLNTMQIKKILILFAPVLLSSCILNTPPASQVPSVSTIDSFDACVAAGNSVMESYPRQCRTNDGQLFVEDVSTDGKRYVSRDPDVCAVIRYRCEINEEYFSDEMGCGCVTTVEGGEVPPIKEDESICTQQYDPVCGEVEVQCIKAPCPPIKQTFSNDCFAKVAGAKNIVPGECEVQVAD